MGGFVLCSVVIYIWSFQLSALCASIKAWHLTTDMMSSSQESFPCYGQVLGCNYHQFVVREGPWDANEITAKHQQCKGLSFNPHKLQILSLSRNLAISPESSCQANCTKRISLRIQSGQIKSQSVTFWWLQRAPAWPDALCEGLHFTASRVEGARGIVGKWGG